MIRSTIHKVEMEFQTNAAVFSPSSVDRGTLAMLSKVQFQEQDRVLDLGCGYGVVGILAAKLIGADRVVMCDIAANAVELARLNAVHNGVPDVEIVQSDGFSGIQEKGFTLILSNPPYHTDFSVAKGFVEEGFRRLALGGRMIMVAKRLDWYRNKLTAVFGGVKVEEADGYYVFIAEKRCAVRLKNEQPKKTLSKKLQRKYGQGSPAGRRRRRS